MLAATVVSSHPGADYYIGPNLHSDARVAIVRQRVDGRWKEIGQVPFGLITFHSYPSPGRQRTLQHLDIGTYNAFNTYDWQITIVRGLRGVDQIDFYPARA